MGVTMSLQNALRATSLSLLAFVFVASSSLADSSHVRIIRLSLVQGQVRFASDVKGDPLASQNATWQNAEPNLPVRQGYVIATDKGRAEVEFENGSMAFLSNGTVLEFYDLSLEDGAKTTRLILRQGTASFYVNPSNGDYFSVTGGDFSVEADGRSNFRLDNFDDGSVVNVFKGRASVIRKNGTTALAKGQSLSMRANDASSVSVASLPADDEFDRWVSGRVDTVQTATNAAQQYVNSPNYSSGLANLYTYGAFSPCAGFGNCWQPYGVGAGWSPFDSGFWFTDAQYGTSFIGNQPWGWLPYHYGGWIFDPSYGWMWAPGAFGGGGGLPIFSPVTGVWLHSKSGPVGIVPVHPLDVRGKTPINLAKGVFPVNAGAVSSRVPVSAGEEWKTLKSVPRGTLSSNLAVAAPPERVYRTLVGGNLGAHTVTLDQNSSIAYDARERRFVNTNSAPALRTATAAQNGALGQAEVTKTGVANVPSNSRNAVVREVSPAVAASRASLPAARAMTPPPAPRSAQYGRGESVFEPSARSSSSAATSAAAPRSNSAPSSSSGARPH
jgi:FecR protein